MLSKKILSRFIDHLEGEQELDKEVIKTFREKIESIFFNEFGICAGEECQYVFEGHPEVVERTLSSDFEKFATSREIENFNRYLEFLMSHGGEFTTTGAIARFIDKLEKNGHDAQKIRKRFDSYTPQASCHLGFETDKNDICLVIDAERILGNIALVQTFRSQYAKLASKEEKESIEELLHYLHTVQVLSLENQISQ